MSAEQLIFILIPAAYILGLFTNNIFSHLLTRLHGRD